MTNGLLTQEREDQPDGFVLRHRNPVSVGFHSLREAASTPATYRPPTSMGDFVSFPKRRFSFMV